VAIARILASARPRAQRPRAAQRGGPHNGPQPAARARSEDFRPVAPRRAAARPRPPCRAVPRAQMRPPNRRHIALPARILHPVIAVLEAPTP